MTDRRFGHLALHYLPGDEQWARTLLELLGCTLIDNGPDPGNDGFCTVLLDQPTANHADNIFFLSQASPAQMQVEELVRAALAADDTALADRYSASTLAAPESISHIGIRYSSFDELEERLLAIDEATGPGGVLEGRATLVKYTVRPGLDPAVDARVAASPAFSGDERPAFANHWIQCFLRTDVLGFGVLALGHTFELDMVFDGFFVEPPSFGRKKA